MGLHFASWQLSTIAVPNAISFYCKMFFQFDTDKLNGLTLVWLLAHSFDQLSMMMLMLKSILSSWISHSHSHSRFGKCMEDKIAPTIFTQEFQAIWILAIYFVVAVVVVQFAWYYIFREPVSDACNNKWAINDFSFGWTLTNIWVFICI